MQGHNHGIEIQREGDQAHLGKAAGRETDEHHVELGWDIIRQHPCDCRSDSQHVEADDQPEAQPLHQKPPRHAAELGAERGADHELRHMPHPVRDIDGHCAGNRQHKGHGQRADHMRHRKPRQMPYPQADRGNGKDQPDIGQLIAGGRKAFAGKRSHHLALDKKEQQRHRGHHQDDAGEMLCGHNAQVGAGLFRKHYRIDDAPRKRGEIGIAAVIFAAPSHDGIAAGMSDQDKGQEHQPRNPELRQQGQNVWREARTDHRPYHRHEDKPDPACYLRQRASAAFVPQHEAGGAEDAAKHVGHGGTDEKGAGAPDKSGQEDQQQTRIHGFCRIRYAFALRAR